MQIVGQILDAVFRPLSHAAALSRVPVLVALAQAAGLPPPKVDEYGTVLVADGALAVAISSGGGRRAHLVAVRGLAPGLRIARTDLGSRMRASAPSSDFEVGDPAFDDVVVLGLGSPDLLCLFDANTREQVRAVFSDGFDVRIAYGELVARLVRPAWRRADAVEPALRRLLALARCLQEPPDAAARLTRIATGDPLGPVRRRALRALLDLSPPDPATRDVLRAAVRDPEAWVRLDAARALGGEGEPVLQGLATDAQTDDEVAAQAIDALGARFAVSSARLVLARAVDAGRVRTAVAALAALARGGGAEAEVVADLLSRSAGPLAVAAADALGTLGGPAAESALVAALGVPETAVAAAAAAALGRSGGVACVPDLKAVESRGGDIRRAARTAVASIQLRLTGATPGQVSLAGGEAGQLSAADGQDGRVSFEPEA